MKRSPVILVVAAALGLASCRSTTPVRIEILPPDAPMGSVTADGKAASSQDAGLYVTKVAAQKEKKRLIDVVGRSTDGIEAATTVEVTGGQEARAVLRMPAEVEVRVVAGEVDSLRIGDRSFSPDQAEGGVYRRRIEPLESPEPLVVWARGKNGLVDRRTLDLRGGRRQIVELNLNLEASFEVSEERVPYGKDVVFDASLSSPSGSLDTFHWDFGDGTEAQTREAVITHRYTFDPSRGETAHYRPSLRVVSGGQASPTASKDLEVFLDRTSIAFDVEIFPKRSGAFHPGETIQLKLTPKAGFRPEDVTDLTFDFGDGTSTRTTASGAPLSVRYSDGKPVSLLLSHRYEEEGAFRPAMTYRHPLLGEESSTAAQLALESGSGLRILVTPAYLTDEQLIERAWEDAYAQLDALLRGTHRTGDENPLRNLRLALTSLDDANYEGDREFTLVLERLIRMFVADGYHVLEKSSQVLARLAPESVVDITEDLREGRRNASSDALVYRENLDYGLKTEYRGEKQPIIYSLQLAGTEDRMTQLDRSDAATRKERADGSSRALREANASVRQASAEGEQAVAQQSDSTVVSAIRSLPVLVARFDTAEILLALRVLEKPAIEEQHAVQYSELFSRPVMKRTATVPLRIRVLERTGRILEARDIIGRASEMVIEDGMVSVDSP